MPRSLSASMRAVANADVVKPVVFVDMDFDAGELNLWSGFGELNHFSKTYVGAGNLLNISAVQENVELRATGLSITLSGILQPLLNKALNDEYQGREVTVWLGGMDGNNDVIGDPVIIFSGFMDTMSIADGGDTSTIQLSVENRLIEFERTRVRRYTNNDQKIEHPTDKGLEYVAEIQEKSIVWGDKDANPISYGNGGYGASIAPPRIPF